MEMMIRFFYFMFLTFYVVALLFASLYHIVDVSHGKHLGPTLESTSFSLICTVYANLHYGHDADETVEF